MKLTSLASMFALFFSSSILNASANPAQATPAAAPPAAAATPAAKSDALTVEGTVKKVVAKKMEIYVVPNDGGKKMEFYFPKDAQFIKAEKAVGFDALKEGQKVRVTYTKKGKRLNPSKAEILE
jgi:hypothetical protein